MKKPFALFVAAVASLMAQSNASAATEIINFNFAPSICGGDHNIYTGIAVAGASSQTWNQLINNSDGSGSLDTILYSDGTLVSGASIKWTSDGNRDIDTDTNFEDSYKNLMGTYDFVSGSEKEKITLKGLTPGDEYTLYLYSQDGGNSKNDVLKFSVNGGSVITLNSENGQGTDFIEGQNFSESLVTVNSDGKLIIKYLELQEKNGRIKKLKTSIDNIYVSILLVKGIPRLNESVSGYKRHGYTQRGFSATLPCYGYFFHRSSQTSGS